MKNAYEIALARLEKAKGPGKTLTGAQKSAIGEIEKRYEAKIAQARIDYESKIAVAPPPERAPLQTALAQAIRDFEEKRDREKDAIWNEAGA